MIKIPISYLGNGPLRSNPEWAVDFACDGLVTGCGIRILANRGCLHPFRRSP